MFRDFSKYEIFEDGRIWSKKSKKFLKPATRPDGYQRVGLVDNEGQRHFQYVHRVCWIAVNGREVPEGMELNHLDEDKKNNAIWNLQLCTKKENCNFGTRNSRIAKAQTNHPDRSKRVAAYDKNGELVMVFPSINETRRQGFSQGNISQCCRNCYKREGNNVYKGFEWRYLDDDE